MEKRKSRKAVNNENKCIQSAVKSFTRVYAIVRLLTQNLAKNPPPNPTIGAPTAGSEVENINRHDI